MRKSINEKRPNLPADIAIGISDGLIIPFALLAGLSGAVQDVSSIKYIGIIAIAVVAAAFGVSAYLTGKEDREAYYAETEEAQSRGERARELLSGMELNEEVQQQVIRDIETDKLQWHAFLKKYELIPGEYSISFITRRALNIGFAYALGGLLPLLPYLFLNDIRNSLIVSFIITIPCLFLAGYMKGRLAQQNAWAIAGGNVLKGTVTALAAYCLASIFR